MRYLILAVPLFLFGCANPEKQAVADDSVCKGYGAQPGTDIYIQCRMKQAEMRNAIIASGGNRTKVCRNYGGTVVCS